MILVPLKFGEPWRISWAGDDTVAVTRTACARVTFCEREPATVTSTQARVRQRSSSWSRFDHHQSRITCQRIIFIYS